MEMILQEFNEQSIKIQRRFSIIRSFSRTTCVPQILILQFLNKMIIFLLLILMQILASQTLPPGFDYVKNFDKTIQVQARYFTPGNFVGEVIDGYLSNTAILTIQAGQALAKVQKDCIQQGYSLVVYDAYRPKKAVAHFMRWSQQPQDYKTKAQFYPNIDKKDIIPQGYVAPRSGHSRGSTIDLTMIALGQELHPIKLITSQLTDGSELLYRDDGSMFTCSHFDFFGQPSHHDTDLMPKQCAQKRNLLRTLMMKHGFRPLHQEWWHYTLNNEPYPDTYFDFDVK